MLPEGFIRAICESPHDDLPRLIAADFLEENAGEMRCPSKCFDGWIPRRQEIGADHCPTCKGTGTVSDGRRELAEFIRVQVELAAGKCTNTDMHGVPCRRYETESGRLRLSCDWCKREQSLRKRERELVAFADAAGGWFDTRGLPAFLAGTETYGSPACIVRRGFIDEVHGKLATLVGGTCERCEGLMSRGVSYCSYCHGTGNTTGIAVEISKSQPVISWIATDVHPTPGSGDVWYFDEEVCEAVGMQDWGWTDEAEAMKVFNEHLAKKIASLAHSSTLQYGNAGGRLTAAQSSLPN